MVIGLSSVDSGQPRVDGLPPLLAVAVLEHAGSWRDSQGLFQKRVYSVTTIDGAYTRWDLGHIQQLGATVSCIYLVNGHAGDERRRHRARRAWRSVRRSWRRARRPRCHRRREEMNRTRPKCVVSHYVRACLATDAHARPPFAMMNLL